jgi:RNA-directed DNA polymerase
MKRQGFLFEKAFSRENIYQAYVDASKGKHKRRACFNFEKRLAYNLDKIYKAIHDGTYKPHGYFEFKVYEPKERRIFAPSFRDLVVQHAIYRIIYPIFNSGFIDQSFACRKGKGTHKAADFAQASLRTSPQESYAIKLDIKKFFYSIDRQILQSQIERKIKDKRLVDMMMLFAEYGEPIGIPIGNLLSQTYALIYLNPLDHFIKREIKAKKYCRYVDDFVLFGLTKQECLDALEKIKVFIDGLRIKLSKYTIAKVKRGLNFVGFRTWSSKRFIRKHSIYKFSKCVKSSKILSVISILGHAKKTHTLQFLLRSLKSSDYRLYCLLPKVYLTR